MTPFRFLGFVRRFVLPTEYKIKNAVSSFSRKEKSIEHIEDDAEKMKEKQEKHIICNIFFSFVYKKMRSPKGHSPAQVATFVRRYLYDIGTTDEL